MAVLLKGAPVAAARMEALSDQITHLNARGITPCLAIVRVGAREEDLAYEQGALRRAGSLGIEVRKFLLPEEAEEIDLIRTLEKISEDPNIHGCLLFRPLPAHLNTERVVNALCPEKDIDGMTSASMGGLLTQAEVGFAPCTAAACMEILRHYQIPLQGKKVTVIGKSTAVGLPAALLLMNEDATVSVCHILTDPKDTLQFCQDADIIISAAGCRNLIRAEHVRAGQIVLDVGINSAPDGSICGDVDFERVEPIVAAITPVPGGVGTVTSTVLCGHAVEAAQRISSGEL